MKPTPEEVSAYGQSIGFQISGEKFCDYYESKGWLVGKNPMRDWAAAVRVWKSWDTQFKGQIQNDNGELTPTRELTEEEAKKLLKGINDD